MNFIHANCYVFILFSVVLFTKILLSKITLNNPSLGRRGLLTDEQTKYFIILLKTMQV
ncbi:hypothetical protein A1OE_460 [Candidatus Endolissoclinum faulkneri L2]|uniref:Uncharacterized protein n=1 Tax=Candidatus Endolissoclinum faulkneri L2 TaxID=1193729 RepID=K7Z3T1_9PROT|nr:hypothetical protein A1OE_460 [Candidatus Endolissoclinum faulkneri L2]